MNKVIKIILSTISTVILLLVLVPMVASLLLNLSSVQNFAVDVVARWLSNKAGTVISIGHVRLGLFNRAVLNDVYVEDLGGDTLLYANRLGVSLRTFNPVSGNLAFGDVKLSGGVFNLAQDSTGTMNLKYILDKFKSRKPRTRKGFRTRASSLDIDGMSFRLQRYNVRPKEYGLDFSSLGVSGFTFRGSDIRVDNDSISLSIGNISFREKSGFELQDLSAKKFTVSPSGIWAEDFRFLSPSTDLNLNYLVADYAPSWQGFKNIVSDLRFGAEIVDSDIALSTISFFVPSLRGSESVFGGFTGSFEGTVDSLRGIVTAVSVRDTRMNMEFAARGLPDIKKAGFDLKIGDLYTDSDDIEFLYSDLTHKDLDTAVLNNVNRMHSISFRGDFKGSLDNFIAMGQAATSQGGIEVDARMHPGADGGRAFAGKIGMSGFDIGDLLDVESLGSVSLHADVDGTAKGKDLGINASAVIPSLAFNGYSYSDINLKGMLGNRAFEGAVESSDPNANFRFDGRLDFADSIPSYNFELELANADLYRLNFNRRDSVSLISCMVAAEGTGMNLDNINGVVKIDSLTYINHIDTIRTGEIRLVADNNARNKLLAMYSSFADVELRGQLGYADLISYMTNSLVEYLPSISRSSGVRAGSPRLQSAPPAGVDGYYALTVDVKEANNVAGIFVPGLDLAEGSNVSFLFNPYEDRFSLSANADYIEKGNFLVTDLDVAGRNEGDSISLYVRTKDVYAGNFHMPNFSVQGGVKQNRINLATSFNNPDNGMYVMLSTVSALQSDSLTGTPQVKVNFRPSTFSVEDQTWNIVSRDITIDSTMVDVDGFWITNGPQQLAVDGTVSRNTPDTLHIRLNRFDLTPFSSITAREGYDVSGIVNGNADFVSGREGMLSAGITFDSVKINDVDMPSTRFSSSWDFDRKRAMLFLTDTHAGDTLVRGFYRPTDKRFYACVSFDSVDMSLLSPVTEGVIKDNRGYARLDLEASNQDGRLRLDGRVGLPEFRTVVEYTNVEYSASNIAGRIDDGVLKLDSITLFDPSGNSAAFDMTMNFQNFSNLSYAIDVHPKRMMVLNTTVAENEVFYGTVFASGSGSITGNKRGVNMNIIASTDNNSHFFLPLGSSATASTADFIEFRNPRPNLDTLSQADRKKAMLERRLRRRSGRGGADFPAELDITMQLNIRPNIEVQLTLDPEMENVLRVTGNGNLNIHVNPLNNVFDIYGDYGITDGSYRFSLQNNLLTKLFSIETGSSIQWTGNPVDAILNISAIYRLKASLTPLIGYGTGRSTVPVDCRIFLKDRLSRPEISFDVQVPNADPETQSLISNALNTQEMMATQFLWLLATNTFSNDQYDNIGTMAYQATGIDFLSGQLSRILSTERFSLVPKYRMRNEVNSDEIGLAISAEIVKDRLTLEVDGNYDTGNNITMSQRTGLTGDVYLNWLIDPQGNLRAKAFTRTIDRYDETRGLQESGIGISYQRSFDSFRDFMRRNREKRKPVSGKSDEMVEQEK